MSIAPNKKPRNSRANLTRWNNTPELLKIIFILAIPVTITNVLHSMIGFVDVNMISSLGSEALASMSVGRTAFWMVSSVFMGLGTGVVAYVARFTGAERHEKAKAYGSTGAVAAAVIGLIIMAIGLLLGEAPVHYMVASNADVDPASLALTQKYAWDFMRVLFIGMAGLGVQFATVSVFNSLGRTMYPMWLLVISNIANFIGNWLLIRRYEVAGCAWSTVITTAITAGFAVFWLIRHGNISWAAKYFGRPLQRSWEMLKLGLPATLAVALRALAGLAIIKLITFLPNSVVGQSALLVGLQAESLAFMPAFAFSTAAATLVGQNLGARQVKQAKVATWVCVLGAQIIMFAMGAVFLLKPEWLIIMFIRANAPEVVAPASEFLRIMAWCLPGLAVSMTINGALRGSGDTKVAAIITTTSMWFIRVPLVTILALDNIGGTGIGFGMGLPGIWWGMTASVYVEALLVSWRFLTDRWARIKLAEA